MADDASMVDAGPGAEAGATGAAPDQQARWLGEIMRAERRDERWRKRCKKIVRRYSQQGEVNGAKAEGEKQFALLWANTETIEQAIYSRPPVPAVTRRHHNANPVARTATVMLERAIACLADSSELHERLKSVRKDLALCGRGTVWFRYEPKFKAAGPGVPPEGGESLEPGEGQEAAPPQEELETETIEVDYVYRDDFIHGPGRTWAEVPWVGRKVYLSAEDGQKRFGKGWSGVALDHKVEGDKDDEGACKATVYEVWSKADDRVYFVAKSAERLLEERAPMLRLKGFFPCPRPAYGTLTNERLEPTPDYVFYQDQAEEVDKLTKRIAKLEAQLKLVGFFAAGPSGEGSAAIKRALQANVENEMIPVPGWAAFAEKGGAKAIEYLPIDMVAKILDACIAARRTVIEDVYQITGISDIMRGSSEASETLGAQRLKSQWGSTRVRAKQEELARFARDCCRIFGEVVAEAFSPETLLAMTDMQLPSEAELQQQAMMAALAPQAAPGGPMGAPAGPMALPAPVAPPGPPVAAPGPFPPGAPGAVPPGVPGAGHNGGPPLEAGEAPVSIDAVMALLRDDALRGFVIDIETDSTVQADEDAEKQRRTELITALGGFMQQWGPAVLQKPELAPMVGQLLLFGLRGFRVGRELEEVVEKAFAGASALTPQMVKGPDPKVEAEKVRAQADIEIAKLSVQGAGLKLQASREAHVMTMQERLAAHHTAVARIPPPAPPAPMPMPAPQAAAPAPQPLMAPPAAPMGPAGA